MPDKLKILYAEDNRITSQETSEALEENGYIVHPVYDGNEAWLAFQDSRPDIVLLDYQMPHRNGIEVFLLIRQIDPVIPVLILSSYTELCAASLKIGTSDFVRKDGGIDEICARIEAAWQRRSQPGENTYVQQSTYQLSNLTCFYPSSTLLVINGQRIPLNKMLSELLAILCQNKNRFISGTTICKRLWNNDCDSKIHLLRDYISELRKLLKDDHILHIRSAYGKGYCLEGPVD